MKKNKMKYGFPPIADKNAGILILGSLPSVLSLQTRQYYGNPQNHFWRLLYALFEREPDAEYEDRKKFLLSKKIALWDSVAGATNPGSLDGTIKNIIPNDFGSFFAEHPRIGHIFFNGSKSEEVFRKYVPSYYDSIPHTRLPSSSPIPTRQNRSFMEKLESWRIVKKIWDKLS